MDCWQCQKTALGTCRFCGRGVCQEHVQLQPFVLDLFRGGPENLPRALVVPDALWCGLCSPRPDPVDLPELDT
jgi:hypothetical protein